jgi:hypothetical protein
MAVAAGTRAPSLPHRRTGVRLVKGSGPNICPRIILEGTRGNMADQKAASKVERQFKNDGTAVWSDDECVQKLATLIEIRDSRDLAEIAKLIGRLAVPVE